jgi:lipopolysaccharide export system protein LptC
VIHLPRPLLLFFLLPALAAAATTQISSQRPIINFSLPNFTPEGYRAWLIRGSEARYLNANEIEIKELTLSIFSGLADEKVATMILSPQATVLPVDSVITGPDTIRVINDQFEATGSDWRYVHKEQRVTINRKVHVVFQAQLKEFLK